VTKLRNNNLHACHHRRYFGQSQSAEELSLSLCANVTKPQVCWWKNHNPPVELLALCKLREANLCLPQFLTHQPPLWKIYFWLFTKKLFYCKKNPTCVLHPPKRWSTGAAATCLYVKILRKNSFGCESEQLWFFFQVISVGFRATVISNFNNLLCMIRCT